MGKHKAEGKNKKGSQLVLRLDKAERDAFVSLCEQLDTSAAREIRRFMREFVAANAVSDLGAAGVERVVIADVPHEPEVDAPVAPAADAPVKATVDDAEKPKRKPRRAQH